MNPSKTLYSRVYKVFASDSERFTQLAMDLGTLAALRLSDSPSAVRLTENYQKSIVLRKKFLKGRFFTKKATRKEFQVAIRQGVNST